MLKTSCTMLLLSASVLFLSIFAQARDSTQDSWPHAYPGMPDGDYSPEWQPYFQVTEKLPNVTWSLSRNWAGNVAVQRPDHPNDTLFFWAFESSDGSFTACSDEPWGIWLNGGPGASSLVGLLYENGPIQISGNYSAFENQYAWTNIADMVWLDQPVGTGFGTVDPRGLVADEDQVAADFMGFLGNFVKVFPNLANRPLYITGESYAGTYIPYIAKAYFGMQHPPVRIAGLAIGDGMITSYQAGVELPVMSVLETYPQIIGYDTEVFEYFWEQSTLCGYNLTLQYPQPGHFPTLNPPLPTNPNALLSVKYEGKFSVTRFMYEAQDRLSARLQARGGSPFDDVERLRARNTWRRDLTGRPNGTTDPWYQCDLLSEMVEYAINFTSPWLHGGMFDVYNVPDALSPESAIDPSVFLNDNRTRAAIHAPTTKDWAFVTHVVFEPTNSSTNPFLDPSVEPMAFLTDLATNMTSHGVKMIIFSGNDDSLLPHFGSQLAIQNATFGGIQGFTRKPETPWYNDAGEFAGIVHQERGWKYVLVDHGGHALGYTNPISAFVLAREFIFGNNRTGLVTNSCSETVTVVGGEMSSLGSEIMTGQAAIYYGSGTTESSYLFPSATVKAWDDYIATATMTSVASGMIH